MHLVSSASTTSCIPDFSLTAVDVRYNVCSPPVRFYLPNVQDDVGTRSIEAFTKGWVPGQIRGVFGATGNIA